MMDKQAQKFNQLPQDIRDVLMSDIDFVLNNEICQRYGLKDRAVVDHSGLVYNLLAKRAAINDLPTLAKKLFNLDQYRAQDLAKDIVGKRLLIFDDYFGGQASQVLKSWGGNVNNYQKDIYRQKQAIGAARQARQKERQAEAEPIPQVDYQESDPVQEKRDALDLFKNNLVNLLLSKSEGFADLLDDYNGVLINLLDNDLNFRRELQSAFYQNQEKLTNLTITLDGRPAQPTIANWLKDFMTQKGAAWFDNVVLSDYLTTGANVKALTGEEKESLAALLVLYRHLRFFPQDLANLPPEDWEIIPLNLEGVSLSGKSLVKSRPAKPSLSAKELADLSPIEIKALQEAGVLNPEDLKK